MAGAHHYRWIVLLCGFLAYATSQLTRRSETGLGACIRTDLHLDKAALGLMGAASCAVGTLGGWTAHRLMSRGRESDGAPA